MIESNLLLLATGTLLLLNGIIASRAKAEEDETILDEPVALDATSPSPRASDA